MNRVFAIARRELDAYFATAIGWLSLMGFVLLTAVFFLWDLFYFAEQSVQAAASPYGGGAPNINEHLIPGFFSSTAVILLFVTPSLTMRLFSEDIRQKSMELLLASPVSSLEIVLGKYLGALGFMAVMLGCTLHYVAVLAWLSNPDWRVVFASYLGVFLLTAAFLGVGLLTSSFTRNQLVASGLSFGILLLLWIFGGIGGMIEGKVGKFLEHLSVLPHMEEISKGLMHSEDIVYFITFIGFFLFATHQRVEAMRWQ